MARLGETTPGHPIASLSQVPYVGECRPFEVVNIRAASDLPGKL